jgi:sulfur-oxidizing protein SoxX
MRRAGPAPVLAALAVTLAAATPHAQEDAMPRSLTGRAGDVARGESLVMNRATSLCLLCHRGPFPEPHAQGTLAPDLTGIGSRLSLAQIRLRVADMQRLNPATIMPAYYRIADYERVAEAWRGKPVLSGSDIEDIVAFLATLRE